MVGSGLFLGLAPQVFRQKLIKPAKRATAANIVRDQFVIK
jgi:hypothetical protein